ncbi:MAG TPA: efflux RND transporter permease subunit [Lacipirellulaceae bacterium]|jgi:multidrug efflux pump|nr:efflux RND transporter permease subunit [Lacipirellulaceae bacterium]
MISRFFINRPIFASVVSIVITLIGGIALFTLPIAQYPRITPPGVSITINYPGASARVVADTVAAPIEQQVNGVPGMLYMSSQMGNDGAYTLTVTFDTDVDLNTAVVMVQNRVTLAMPQLPTEVQKQGITIRKRTPDILMVVNFYSPDDRYDNLYLSNYATVNVRDELLRVPGVSDVTYQGQRDYSIRAWLDPQKLAACNITAIDVENAIRDQNLDAPAGQLGQSPAPKGQTFQLPLDTLGRLSDPEEFGNIIVKVGASSPPPTPTGSRRSTISATAGATSPGSSSVPGAAATPASTQASPSSTGGGASTSSTSAAAAAGRRGAGLLIAGTQASGGLNGGANSGGGASAITASIGVSAIGGASAEGGGTTGGGGMTNGSSTSATTSTSTSDMSSDPAAITGMPLGGVARQGPGQPSVAIVRLKDLARVEIGAQNYNQSCLFDGKPTVGLAVFQLPGTNALDVADAVRAKMQELKSRFPQGLDYAIAYDTTPYIRESVSDVARALFQAIALVGVVVLVFLQNWRSVIIPLIAVPIAIISTFAVMALLGFSLNNISLFGLVLAIGIVVDDAIVVVENVERWMEQGLPAREATERAMDEVTGPIIAVALVLCAVFVPCAFVGGITGQFFKQFAVTISASTLFSTISSLTLSPALAAILIRPREERRDIFTRVVEFLLGWFFNLFNKSFSASTSAYVWIVKHFMRLSVIVLSAYGLLLLTTYFVFAHAPSGFVPQQDQGRLLVSVQLPDSASLVRTEAVVKQAVDIATHTPGIAHTVGISGMSFVLRTTAPNFASMFIVLDPFDKRQSPALRDTAIMAKLRTEWGKKIKDGVVTVFPASPVPGLGAAGGFKVMVEDRGDLGFEALEKETDTLVHKLQTDVPGLVGVNTNFRSRAPQLFMNINRMKAASLGVSLQDVNQTIDILLGSVYVNSFNKFGRHWQVVLQADGAFRDRAEDVNLFKVRNNQGEMVPLGTLCELKEFSGPASVERYNLYVAASIIGNLRPGMSSGDAIKTVEKIANDSLPLSMKADWTELMYLQKRAGNTSIYVFFLSVACVFLALAALYESWTLPLAVILVVPLCILWSVTGILLTHRDVNIFVQIGMIVLVALACKNSILIVEFARQLHEVEGHSRLDATLEASRLRLRPILMTSFAFIFGVLPLVAASGAGAEMRRSLGISVFSGMLGVTILGIFLTPVFFYVIEGLGESEFFGRPVVRRVGSVIAVALLGATVGLLLGALEVVQPGWAALVGAVGGASIMMGLLQVHRMRETNGSSRGKEPPRG